MQTEANVTEADTTAAVEIGKADTTQPASAEVTQPPSEVSKDPVKIGSPENEPEPDDYHNVIPYVLVIGGGLVVILILAILIHALKKDTLQAEHDDFEQYLATLQHALDEMMKEEASKVIWLTN